MTTATFAAPAVRRFTAFRWWFAEVVREDVANDNVDAATWARQVSDWADSRAPNPSFAAFVFQARVAVVAARQANRPAVVR